MRPEPAPVQHKTIECLFCFKWYITPCANQAKADGCANLAAAKMLVREGGTLVGQEKHQPLNKHDRAKATPKGKAKGKPKPKRKR